MDFLITLRTAFLAGVTAFLASKTGSLPPDLNQALVSTTGAFLGVIYDLVAYWAKSRILKKPSR